MWQYLIPVLGSLVQAATPVVRTELTSLLDKLEKLAAETPNPVDDILVKSLRSIMLGDKS